MFYIIKSHNLGMNKLLQKITVVILFLGWVTLSAQNVGINAAGTAPSGDAMLDISSADKGLLIPRVSITNLTLIGPITGGATTSLLVYNTNGATGLGYHYWDGNDWIKFLSILHIFMCLIIIVTRQIINEVTSTQHIFMHL